MNVRQRRCPDSRPPGAGGERQPHLCRGHGGLAHFLPPAAGVGGGERGGLIARAQVDGRTVVTATAAGRAPEIEQATSELADRSQRWPLHRYLATDRIRVATVRLCWRAPQPLPSHTRLVLDASS